MQIIKKYCLLIHDSAIKKPADFFLPIYNFQVLLAENFWVTLQIGRMMYDSQVFKAIDPF